MSILITLVTTCFWFLLVWSFTGANQANIDCLKTFKSQVEDPNEYLSSWDFANESGGFICKFSGVTCWHDDENRVLSIILAVKCSDLTRLNLSGNNFSGPLPSNLATLIPLVTTLGLSYNSFSGEIPASISNITYLNTLVLQHNQFSGQLPPQLASLGRLNKFSVAYNFLTGPIPNFMASLHFGPESFVNNLGLCGPPMDSCISPDRPGPGPEEEMIRFGEIGAAVGAALFVPVGATLGWFFSKGKKEKQGDIRHRN